MTPSSALQLATFADVDGFKPAELMEDASSIPLDVARFAAASPIYTAGLAAELGVSMRTLGSAVSKIRGMSLHQYIRLKKLWTTRARLLRAAAA